MSFDPYYHWLGIPPAESAGEGPNHYRLLGLSLLEENADAISNAADRVMSHLRTFQTGKNAALSQKLLGEVAQARICLLDPHKKAAYDRELLSHFALPEEASEAVAAPPTAPQPAMTIRMPVRPNAVKALRKRKSRMLELTIAVAGVAVLIASAAACAYLWRAAPSTSEKAHIITPSPVDSQPPLESGESRPSSKKGIEPAERKKDEPAPIASDGSSDVPKKTAKKKSPQKKKPVKKAAAPSKAKANPEE